MKSDNFLLEKSRDLLGWNLIQKALAGHSASPATQEKIKSLTPENEFSLAKAAVEETEEMTSVFESDASFPMQAFENMEPILKEAKHHGILEPKQLLNVLYFLKLAQTIQLFFQKRDQLPRLKKLANRINPLKELQDEYNRCIQEEGEIRENATPELRQALRAVRTAREDLEKTLDKLISRTSIKEGLQDIYFTEREGRLVLPVKAEFKARVDGIVHDTSGSGATLFIEPSQTVPLNNQLKINLIRVDREKTRIRKILTEALNEHVEEILNDLEVLVDFDLIHARARLGKSMGAKRFHFFPDKRVNLKTARNPELILNGSKVVPNDISWHAGTDTVIISGPNTGGKTVTLKTVGLMALMAKAGLLLPADERSEMGFFPEVYADIGDDQNIENSLSTFSGHLDKIIHMLNHAKTGSLILLDELGIATDPAQGSALAEAILIELQAKNMTTLVSTHYFSLKAVAQTRKGFLNACTEFDENSHSPTYKLVFGVPGTSAALETAKSLGLDPSIIETAKAIYQQSDTRAENLLQSLHQQKIELEQKRECIENDKKEINQLKAEQESLTTELRDRERSFRKEKSRKLQATVRETRSEIQNMIREIKGTNDLEKIRKTDKRIRTIEQALRSEDMPDLSEWNLPPDSLKTGDAIVVEGYAAKGSLLEDVDGKKMVRVKLGNLETRVEAARLKGNSRRPKTLYPEKTENRITIEVPSKPRLEPNCDLRGLRVGEAKDALETFIDRAMVNEIRRVKIIHGHGMGAVKGFVRDYLKSCGIGKKISPGEKEEGGDGVTIVEF